MQSVLQFKFSPGLDKLEEELRTFEVLAKTYHAIFGEAIFDSNTQTVIKSQMPAEIGTHLELQTFARTTDLVNLMSSLSKMRTAAKFKLSGTSSDADGHRLDHGQKSGQEKEQGEREKQRQ